MIIRIEPQDWSMYSVLMYFDQANPDLEDEEIKSYLAENSLLPKRQLNQELEGRDYEIFSFGGCYLGNAHMKAISEIQRVAVQQELLTKAIPTLLRQSPDADLQKRLDDITGDELNDAVGRLVRKFAVESSFGADDEGHIQVELEAGEVQRAFLELDATRTEA